LEEYLEEKRAEFPRFYFISNDELLRILASSADLSIIEKLISKCFENLGLFLLKNHMIWE
jgi:dynein heavy chain